jgi:hypothetical protein
MKNSIDTIRNRTDDLPDCGTVPQPISEPHASASLLTLYSLSHTINFATRIQNGLIMVDDNIFVGDVRLN